MRRPRCRSIARWLERLAHRIYPEALRTLTVTTNEGERTFIDCREIKPRNWGTCTCGRGPGPLLFGDLVALAAAEASIWPVGPFIIPTGPPHPIPECRAAPRSTRSR